MVIAVVKELEDLQMRGKVKTIQTAALLRSAKILRRVLDTCCHSNFREKQSTNPGMENSQNIKNNK